MREPLTAREVARLVGGELQGDDSRVVDGVAPLDRAGPRHISFLTSAKYASELESSAAAVVLVARELAGRVPASGATIVLVDRPHEAVQQILPRLYEMEPPQSRIAESVRIGRGARIGAGVCIDDGVVIGEGADIGEGTHLYPQVTVYPNTVVGARCIIHAGVRLGSDGFGYVFRDGRHEKVPHVGRCVIGDDVEIGANTTVDRGSIGDTTIGDGTKIDNLVHVAHNVRIGRLCLVMAQAGIAGSTHIGDGVIVAGQAGIGGHARIGDGARIGAQAGVFGDVPAGESWSGYPARPHRESLRATAALMRLPETLKKLGRDPGSADD